MIIVGANIWFVYLFGDDPTPKWLLWLAEVAVICLLAGVVVYLVAKLRQLIYRNN
ncbi:MAG: hypothetical protein OYH77_00535 [Pseudomonadota bacterium]|nr:hypothetical protein [Pseudomonadota bacterium]